MKSCNKCNRDFSDTNLRQLIRCQHIFCGECLVDYLKNITTDRVKCIVSECKWNIADSIIRECLTDDQLIEYERLCISESTSKSFSCLTKACPNIVMYDDGIPTFECEYCKSPNCIKCKKRHYPIDCGSNTADEIEIESRACDALKKRERSVLEQLFKEYCLLPNPSSFECPICCAFILPRKGVKLRNCLHEICEDCLKESMKSPEYISHMKCPISECNNPLDSSEISVLINEEKLATMMRRDAAARFYHCRNEGCTGMWEVTNATISYICDICHQDNCLACEYIHEGMNCSVFRKTKRYMDAQGRSKILGDNRRIKCFLCYNELIHRGGCGAMYCDRCGSNTCIFTGKIAGSHDPQECGCNGAENCSKKDYYCNCTPSKPCHKDCIYGCIAEDH